MGSTLSGLAAWILIFVGVIVIASAATSPGTFLTGDFEWDSWWLVAIGTSFLAEAAWLLPTLLAIVLAFYAALIGQSVANTSLEDVLKTRSRLNPAGLAIASVVIVFDATVGLAAFSSPAQWPAVPGILVVSLAVVLLGIGVGRFEYRSLATQLNMAKRMRRLHQLELDRLPAAPAARPPSVSDRGTGLRPKNVLRAAVLSATLLPSIPFSIAMLVDGRPALTALQFFGIQLVFNSLWTIIGLIFPVILIEWSYLDSRGRRVKIVVAGILVVALSGSAIFTGIFAITAPAPEYAGTFDLETAMFVVPGVLAFVVVEASLFANGRRLPTRLFRWTLRSAIPQSARETRVRAIARLDVKIEALLPAPTAARLGLLGRLRRQRGRRTAP